MKLNLGTSVKSSRPSILKGALAALLLGSASAWAQTTVTSNPADGATGVSPSAAVVFTFSAPMDTANSGAVFTTPPSGFYVVSSVWSAGNTVLTCTPLSPFPNNTTIDWDVFGMDSNSGFVQGTGSFSTGTGTGGGGTASGTNSITTFAVGKLYFNDQLTAGAPAPNPDAAYALIASTSLASNIAATAVTVTVPGRSTPTSLSKRDPLHPENYSFFDFSTNQTSFEAAYPQGGYVFNVTATPNNLQGTDTMPTTMAQPNAPHVTNFAAAQNVNATNSFTLSWDAFQNGTASDYITVSVTDDFGKTVFETPGPGTNGALPGTAMSVTIPAGKLAANLTNTAEIIFYRFVTTSNATYATVAFRATATQFNLVTAGSAVVAPTPVVSKPVWTGSGFGFDVATAVNQSLKVRFTSDLSLPISQWQTLFTTNSPGTSVHLIVPAQAGANGFIRIENGP